MSSKDDVINVEFLTSFNKLKNMIDDDPTELDNFAFTDNTIYGLCVALEDLVDQIDYATSSNAEYFAGPVDPKVITAWRDYENRYKPPLDRFRRKNFEKQMIMIERNSFDEEEAQESIEPTILAKTEPVSLWKHADTEAASAVAEIGNVLKYVEFNIDYEDEIVKSGLEIGIAEWTNLMGSKFDLRGIFRRRKLIPFILVPRHVANRHGSTEKLSLYDYLRQAHNAFVYGAPYAALALMRSLMELVLKTHYCTVNEDIEKMINRCEHRLPRGANAGQLHRLRRLANDILHADKEKSAKSSTDEQLELEVVYFLLTLRALIEGAPQYRA